MIQDFRVVIVFENWPKRPVIIGNPVLCLTREVHSVVRQLKQEHPGDSVGFYELTCTEQVGVVDIVEHVNREYER